MNTCLEVFASYNILQNLCDRFYPCSYICNCLKMPKKSQINEYSEVGGNRTLVTSCNCSIYYKHKEKNNTHMQINSHMFSTCCGAAQACLASNLCEFASKLEWTFM